MKVKILNHKFYKLINHFEDKIYDAINDIHSELIMVNVGIENSLHGWLAFERESLEVVEEKIVKMKVRFLKSFDAEMEQNNFTIGKDYDVKRIDSEGDYWVDDDKGSDTVLLKSEVKVISDETQKDEHYNNENGSLYLFAQQHNLNAWEFDILKRVVRCRKKGQFKEDLEKTKRVIDLYLKEFEA